MATIRPELVSLFSGAGGLDIGLEQAGWQTVTATDVSVDSMNTLRASQAARIKISGSRTSYLHGTRLVERDVKDIGREDLIPDGAASDWVPDLLAGGPPCQPWSSAGSQRGLRDPRGQLIAHMLRLVGDLNPRYVLFENVRGLVTARGETGRPGEVLESIQRDLFERYGYASKVATLNAADFGAPQRRVRLILLATRDYHLPKFPTPTHDRISSPQRRPWVTLGQVLDSLPPPDPSDIVRPTGERAEMLRELVPGKGLRTGGRIMSNRPGGHWGYRQDSFLADLDLPSRTIRAASTPDWIRLPDQDLRRLTWSECAALQGFPPTWSFAGTVGSRFTQIGNAVQADVGRAVGFAVAQALSLGKSNSVQSPEVWPEALRERVRYTESEQRVNGHLRIRQRDDAVA